MTSTFDEPSGQQVPKGAGMKLRIVLDLSKFPDYRTELCEPATVLHELADWLEKKRGEYYAGGKKTLRNFESEEAGYAQITEA